MICSKPRSHHARNRLAAAAGAAALAVVVAGSIHSSPNARASADTPVASLTPAVRAAVPALDAPAAVVPSRVREAFTASGGGPGLRALNPSANPGLARPIDARLPGAPASWVIPTSSGACLAMADAFDAVSVTCGPLDAIERGDVAFEVRGADPDGSPTESGYRLGLRAGTGDGSFLEAIK